MPIIRIPGPSGATPLGQGDGGFGVRRGAFDDQRKANIQRSLGQAIQGSIQLAGAFVKAAETERIEGEREAEKAQRAEDRQGVEDRRSRAAEQRIIDEDTADREKAEAKAGREEGATFEAQANRAVFEAEQEALANAGQDANKPDQHLKRNDARATNLQRRLEGLVDSLETEGGKDAAEAHIANVIPLQLERLKITARKEVEDSERDFLESGLIEGRDQAQASGNIEFLKSGLGMIKQGGAHITLSELEKTRLLDQYVTSPALTLVSEALNDPARREETVFDTLGGVHDDVLGKYKWRARAAAEDAGRELLKFSGITATDSANFSPATNPGQALRDLLSRSDSDRLIAKAVLTDVELKAWDANVAGLKHKADKADRSKAQAADLSLGQRPGDYDPQTEEGKLASTVAFRVLVESPLFKGSTIEEQSAGIANLVALAGNVPDDLGPFIQNLMVNITTDANGESAGMLGALALSFEARGIDVLNDGIQDAILNNDSFSGADTTQLVFGQADVVSGPGAAAAVEFAKRWKALPKDQQDNVVNQLNQGDLQMAGTAFAFGRDRRAIVGQDRQVQFLAQDAAVMVEVDRVFGAGTLASAADTDTKGQLITAARLVAFEKKKARGTEDGIRDRRAALNRQLRVLRDDASLSDWDAVQEVKRIRDLTQPEFEEEFGAASAAEVQAKGQTKAWKDRVTTMVKPVIEKTLFPTFNQEQRIEAALSGKFGNDARNVAEALGRPENNVTKARGWDPGNTGDYDRNDLLQRAADIYEDVQISAPALLSNGQTFSTGLSLLIAREGRSRQVSKFHIGGTIENAPEAIRPDAWEMWKMEFTPDVEDPTTKEIIPGGRLKAYADMKEVIISGQSSILPYGDGRGWRIIVTDPESGIPRDLRVTPNDPTSEVYRLELDADNYLRMQTLQDPKVSEKIMDAFIQQEAWEVIRANETNEEFKNLWGDLGPAGWRQFWDEQKGVAFPLIGARDLPIMLESGTSPDLKNDPRPDQDDLDFFPGSSPPTHLLESLMKTEKKFGFGSVNADQARDLDRWLKNYPLAIERKRDRMLADVDRRVSSGKLDEEESRYEVGKINMRTERMLKTVEGQVQVLKPMLEWYENAEPWGLDQLGSDRPSEVYKNWRAMNLTGQWRAWRSWKGIQGAKVAPKDVPAQVSQWISTGGHEEWMNLPFELRSRHE